MSTYNESIDAVVCTLLPLSWVMYSSTVPSVITQHARGTQTTQDAIDQETTYAYNKDQVVKKLLDHVVLAEHELLCDHKKAQA